MRTTFPRNAGPEVMRLVTRHSPSALVLVVVSTSEPTVTKDWCDGGGGVNSGLGIRPL